MADGNGRTIGGAAARALRDGRARLDRAARAFWGRGDAESVHDVRVACRRLRTALRTYRAVVAGEAVRRRLRVLARSLGPLRDTDVAADLIRRVAGADPAALALASAVEADRPGALGRARRRVRRSLPPLLADLDALARRADLASGTAAGGEPRWARLPLLLYKRWRAVARLVEAVESRDGASLHALRIAAKRLRYVLEGLETPSARRLALRAEAIQDILGASRDAALAAARLRALGTPLAERLAERLDRDAATRLGGLRRAFERVAGAEFERRLARLVGRLAR